MTCEACKKLAKVRALLDEAKKLLQIFADGRKLKIDHTMREATIDGVPIQSASRQFLTDCRKEGV